MMIRLNLFISDLRKPEERELFAVPNTEAPPAKYSSDGKGGREWDAGEKLNS